MQTISIKEQKNLIADARKAYQNSIDILQHSYKPIFLQAPKPLIVDDDLVDMSYQFPGNDIEYMVALHTNRLKAYQDHIASMDILNPKTQAKQRFFILDSTQSIRWNITLNIVANSQIIADIKATTPSVNIMNTRQFPEMEHIFLGLLSKYGVKTEYPDISFMNVHILLLLTHGMTEDSQGLYFICEHDYLRTIKTFIHWHNESINYEKSTGSEYEPIISDHLYKARYNVLRANTDNQA